MDLAGVSFATHFPAVPAAKACAALDVAHYPERLASLLFVNAPGVFARGWPIFRPLVDRRTAAKFRVLSTDAEVLQKDTLFGTWRNTPWWLYEANPYI